VGADRKLQQRRADAVLIDTQNVRAALEERPSIIMPAKRGLQLDRFVLLGRTLEEYRRYFLLDPARLVGKRVLDVAGGVSSFCAEANELGIKVTSFDPIYSLSPRNITERSGPDLESVYRAIGQVPTYRWGYYKNPDYMRQLRERAFGVFLSDYTTHPERYVAGELPKIPFADGEFDLTLVSYFLFAYQDRLDYEFHRDSILEIMRVTRDEARIYPTVTFEAEPSDYIPMLQADPAFQHFQFAKIKTDFEFLVNSNCFLRVTRKESLKL
jgi:SAM-dependent methyltransferase